MSTPLEPDELRRVALLIDGIRDAEADAMIHIDTPTFLWDDGDIIGRIVRSDGSLAFEGS